MLLYVQGEHNLSLPLPKLTVFKWGTTEQNIPTFKRDTTLIRNVDTLL